MSTPVTADSVYELIKSFEGEFPITAPYISIDVGTFDPATGTFTGLSTEVTFDPEPVPHGPHDHPHNPPPHYQGTRWISVTINAKWQRTITVVPAPVVQLAPVLLEFSVPGPAGAWSVTVNGTVVSAAPGQVSLKVGIWDAEIANWTIQAGGRSHSDTLRIQRPAGALGLGVGAFTIPVLPVTIVYAPPADSLQRSVASYSTGQTVGTTDTYSFGTDHSQTLPDQFTSFSAAGDFVAGLSVMADVLTLSAAGEGTVPDGITDPKDAGAAISAISTEIGQLGSTQETGVSDLTETQMTLTESVTDTLSTTPQAGGPGVGDVIHFYRDLRMAWAYYQGKLRICPIGFHNAAYSVQGLAANPASTGVAPADVQLLLSMDPFVPGGTADDFPGDRFTLQETWEYGFGAVIEHKLSVTRDTTVKTTTKSWTTSTDSWEAGPLFKMLGFGEKDQTTVTSSNATGSDVSSTVTADVILASGPQDHFVVNIWYDNVFGTFAFEQAQSAPSPRFQGSGSQAGSLVVLEAGGRIFRTVADQHGSFRFTATSIPDGSALLMIGDHPGQTVVI